MFELVLLIISCLLVSGLDFLGQSYSCVVFWKKKAGFVEPAMTYL